MSNKGENGYKDQGKIADARALLAPIYNWFTEGFDAPDLVEAKALQPELARALAEDIPVRHV